MTTCKDCSSFRDGRCSAPGDLTERYSTGAGSKPCGYFTRKHKTSLACLVSGHRYGSEDRTCICTRCGASAESSRRDLHRFERGDDCWEYCTVCGVRGKKLGHIFERGEGCREYCTVCGEKGKQLSHDFDGGCRCRYCGHVRNEGHRYRLTGVKTYIKTHYCDRDKGIDGDYVCGFCEDKKCTWTTTDREYEYRCEICGREKYSAERLDVPVSAGKDSYTDDPALTDEAADAAREVEEQ